MVRGKLSRILFARKLHPSIFLPFTCCSFSSMSINAFRPFFSSSFSRTRIVAENANKGSIWYSDADALAKANKICDIFEAGEIQNVKRVYSVERIPNEYIGLTRRQRCIYRAPAVIYNIFSKTITRLKKFFADNTSLERALKSQRYKKCG